MNNVHVPKLERVAPLKIERASNVVAHPLQLLCDKDRGGDRGRQSRFVHPFIGCIAVGFRECLRAL